MVRRLRTLSGCLTCRRRRKKCDEARPQCTTCSRLGLRCCWNANAGSDDLKLNDGEREGQFFRACVKGSKIAEDQHDCIPKKDLYHLSRHCQHSQSELTTQCSSWIASTLSPLALAQWRSAETLSAELHGCSVGREAIAAFAATIVTQGEGSVQPIKLELENQALMGVRVGVFRFAHGHLEKHSLPALVISVFLLAFTEVSGLSCI
jgi:hypothetical protein